MLSRRTFGSLMGAAACVGGAAASSASAQTLDLDAISLAAHEAAMRLAIAAAKANPFYPFGAVIIGAADRATLAQGVNDGKTNPIFHGEIAAINDYVARHGNQGWADGILYTTGEACPMCMSAIVWAGPGGGRRHPIHHRRALPDVHERHRLGRPRWGRLRQLDLGAGGSRHRADHDRCERGARRCILLSRPDPGWGPTR